MTTIAAVSRKHGVTFEDGRTMPYLQLFDMDGAEIDDVGKAATAVVECPDGTGWYTIFFADWERVTVH
jgi:hypothetical protein